jgi:flagellar motor switch/type III secretory pathway protein FliN
VLEISPLIIYPIIDRLLGGTNHDLFIPQRPLTQIEQRLIGNVTDRGHAALSEAWASITRADLQGRGLRESNPQLVQIVPPNEVVVVIGFELKMGNRAGTMNLCIPYNVIEPVVEELSAQSWFSAARNQRSAELEKQITRGLTRAPLTVTGMLAETTITLRDLMEMSTGDLIVTEKPAITAHRGLRRGRAQVPGPDRPVQRQTRPQDRAADRPRRTRVVTAFRAPRSRFRRRLPPTRPASELPTFGSFCFIVKTAANRSPARSTRSSAASGENTSPRSSSSSTAAPSSSQVTGIETVGTSRARIEYTHTVVLCRSFWLQSTNTLFFRRSFRMLEVIPFGSSRSIRFAISCANTFV